MSVFSPKPEFRSAAPNERVRLGLDEGYNFGRTLLEQGATGVLTSYGLGTAIRDLSTPQGNVQRTDLPTNLPVLNVVAPGLNVLQGAYNLLKGGIEATRPDQPSMTKDQYEASPYFRKAIPFEEGMTEDRAASLASFFDLQTVREHFSQKQPVASFAGKFLGQALDPINYIPVFGEVASAAAVARFGGIAGRMLLGSSEAVINTAAFSVITANTRAKFGDDVSFQAIATEIGMSALIGGVFGGGIGVLMRRGDRQAKLVRSAVDNIRTTQESLISLNEAVDGLATNGEVALTPNGMAPVEKLRTETINRSEAAKALEAETAGVTGTKAGEIAISPDGTRIAVRPEIVDISTLQRATGSLQVRDRGPQNFASTAQVEQIAADLDPAQLMPNVNGAHGSPIVGPDNVIDSGNGRVMAIQRAIDAYPEKYAAYRQALVDAGYEIPPGVTNPVLISRRTTDLSPEARTKFNADVNGPTTAQMSAVELAQMDRDALTDPVLATLVDAPVDSAGNRPFVANFLANLPANARNALVDRAGVLNADGQRRVENALVAAAYGDVDANVLRRFAEARDDNTRAIVGAMSDAAGKWALMRRAVKAGAISPEFDATPELTQALRLLAGWREQAVREGRSVSVVIREGLGQLDVFTGAIPPETQLFVRMFYRNDHFAQAKGRDALAIQFGRIVDSAFELGQPQLFGADTAVSKLEVIRNAADDIEANLFAPDDAVARAQEVSGGGERPAVGATGEGSGQATGADAGRAAADSLTPEEPKTGTVLATVETADGKTIQIKVGRLAGESVEVRGVNPSDGFVPMVFRPDDPRRGHTATQLLRDRFGPDAKITVEPTKSAAALAEPVPVVKERVDLSTDPKTYKGERTPAVMIGGKLFIGERHSDAVEKAIEQFGADSPEIAKFEEDPEASFGRLASKAGKSSAGVPYKKGFKADGISGDDGASIRMAINNEKLKASTDRLEAANAARRALPATIGPDDPMPFAPDRYFTRDEKTVDVPLDLIDPIRARPEGIANAGKFMRMAYNGELAPREGISLRREANGRYTLLDGNSTYANAAAAGWPSLPGRVLTDAEFAAETAVHAAEKAAKNAKKVAALMPRRGAATALDAVPEKLRQDLDIAFKESQPARSLDDLYAVAQKWQNQFAAAADELGAKFGLEFKNPGLKKKATTAAKMERKHYASTSQLTDVVRGGFVVKTPEQAEGVVAGLAKQFALLDEGWRMTDAGYFDRKILVQFEDGTIGELQFWHPDLLDAKSSKGHALYEEMRAIKSPDDPRYQELLHQQRRLYLDAIPKSDEAWQPVIAQLLERAGFDASGKDTSGNASAKASGDSLLPESTTSAGLTSVQAPSAETMASALPPVNTAGLDSQSKNLSMVSPTMGGRTEPVNATRAAPEPIPEGLDAAAARVGKGGDMRALAEQHSVDLTTGDFPEMYDIEQMRAEGRLTAEDEAAIKAADDAFVAAESYGNSLKAAAACMV